MEKILCVDIGGTGIKYTLITEDGQFGEVSSKETPKDMPGLKACLASIGEEYVGQFNGVAISMPGLLDSQTGHAKHGGALLFINELNIRDEFKTVFPTVPVQVENDGKCAALGEQKFGELQGVGNGVAIVLGTGVGGGIIVNGKLLRGAHLSAGEFSFIRTNAYSDVAEDYLAMQGSVPMLAYTYSQIKQVDHHEMSGERFFAAVHQGEEEAVTLLEQYAKRLSKQLFNIQTILDPEIITIGGGVSSQTILLDYLNREIQAEVDRVPMPIIAPTIVQSKLGNKANLLGALSFFLDQENKNN